jgi:hypothetical protein
MRPEGVEVVEDGGAAYAEDVAGDEEVFCSLFEGREDGGWDWNCWERVVVEIGNGTFDGSGNGSGVGVETGIFLDDGSGLVAEDEGGGVVIPGTLQFAAQALPTRRGFLVALSTFNKFLLGAQRVIP